MQDKAEDEWEKQHAENLLSLNEEEQLRIEGLYQDFLLTFANNEDAYITCGDDETVFVVSFDPKRRNFCTLTSLEGQDAKRQKVVNLVRQLKGVPILYHTESAFAVQINE